MHRRVTLSLLVMVSLLMQVSSRAQADADRLTAAARAALAQIKGTARAPGLHKAVRVQRDRWGVAHIYASDSHDLFFAQGYVAAQDRLFQMELWKRAGQGRLAEILGPSAVERDAQARRLRYRGDIQAEYASYAPDTLQILEAFTDGINAYIEALRAPGGQGLPVEFQVAGFAPEPWRPADCLNRLAAYSMMNNASAELLHAQLVALLGARQATSQLTFEPHAQLTPAAGVDFTGLSPALLANVVSSDRRIPFPLSSLQESNNWTVSGKMTTTGKPILANDPHRVIAEPSLRYIVHLVAPGWNVIGAGEPALPGVAAGHNERIAWGFTIFGLDQQDLYLETLDPAQPNRYKTPAGWQAMTVSSEKISVRGGSAVTVSLRYTRHGPVLWEDGKRALALRWVGAEPGTAGYLGSLSLDRAQNWKEFERAMPRWKVPSENIVYADRRGNIGEHSTGLAPRRIGFNGLLPLPGDGRFEWQGFVPTERLPHRFNPGEQFIATANHKMIADDYPDPIGFEWAPPTRFQRIHSVLETARRSGHKVSVGEMGALQSDVLSLNAQLLQPMLQAALSAPERRAQESTRAAAELLLHWDGELRAESAAAVLFELWIPELTRLTMDRMVPAAAREVVPAWPATRVIGTLASLPEGRDALLLDALASARRRLEALQGNDPAKWSWGALHEVYFRHPFDAMPGAAPLFDRGPFPRSGDANVVQATTPDPKTFEQVSGASYREVFDLSDWDRSLAVNVPGQSGQPTSPHYDDLLPLWRAGQFFQLAYTRGAVDAATTDTLELEP